jgi:hypothetical protein
MMNGWMIGSDPSRTSCRAHRSSTASLTPRPYPWVCLRVCMHACMYACRCALKTAQSLGLTCTTVPNPAARPSNASQHPYTQPPQQQPYQQQPYQQQPYQQQNPYPNGYLAPSQPAAPMALSPPSSTSSLASKGSRKPRGAVPPANPHVVCVRVFSGCLRHIGFSSLLSEIHSLLNIVTRF